jgi:hypothetical protein
MKIPEGINPRNYLTISIVALNMELTKMGQEYDSYGLFTAGTTVQ